MRNRFAWFAGLCVLMLSAASAQTRPGGGGVGSPADKSSTSPQVFNGPIAAPNLPVDISAFGGLTSNADNSTAIANASIAAAAVGGCVTASNGVFQIQNPVQFAAGASLCLQPGTTIQATAAMAAVLQTPLSTRSSGRTTFSGGTIDGNGFAVDGIFAQYSINVHFSNITITQATTHGIHVGNQSAPGTSVQVYVDKSVWVNAGSITPQAGSSGIFFDRATDCGIDFSAIVNNYPIGEIATSGNIILNGHVWNGTAVPLQTGFELLGARDSLGDGWYADTALTNGVVISGANVAVNQGTCFMNSSGGNDNTANCINVTAANLNPAITNVVVNGSSASFRYAKDINTPNRFGMSVTNLQDSNVVTQICGTSGFSACNLVPSLTLNLQPISNTPEMMQNPGSVTLATLGNLSGNPMTVISPITITRLEWQLNATATGCTTSPIVTILVNAVASAFTATIPLTGFFGHQDGTLSVPAGTGVQMKVTTASAGCTPTTSTAQITLHYIMQ
jgi:hypothetical protein